MGSFQSNAGKEMLHAQPNVLYGSETHITLNKSSVLRLTFGQCFDSELCTVCIRRELF